MKFKYFFFLLIFSSIVFSQDVYPFFSNPIQQLDFEKKRVYIKEFDEKRQYIKGGGDIFNILSLFSDTEPIYKTAPISTSYYYDYTFEIIQNGILLNELEFLQFIGLTELYDNIILDYHNKFEQYQRDMADWKNNKYYYEIKKTNNTLIVGGLIVFGTGVYIANMLDNKKTGLAVISVGTLGMIVGFGVPQKVKLEKAQPIEPVLKQHLTNDQIKAIAESHNRKIFNEILGTK